MLKSECVSALKSWFDTNKNDLKLPNLLKDTERTKECQAVFENLLFDFSKDHITKEVLSHFQKIYQEKNVAEKIDNFFGGKDVNFTEKRGALHFALRDGPNTSDIKADGQKIAEQIETENQKILKFSKIMRSGEFLGASEKKIETIICIGIGGSLYGTKSAYEGLKMTKEGNFESKGLKMQFLADIDPLDFKAILEDLDVETSLVIILSKSFTTEETMTNAESLKNHFIDTYSKINSEISKESIVSHHFCAVGLEVSKQKMTDFGVKEGQQFYIWDWVGGRYSVSSAIGVLPLSLVFGFDTVQKMLKGMRSIDFHFYQEKNIEKNIPLLLGFIGFYNSVIKGYSSRAVLPYNVGLSTFYQHIQQATMESNGKGVNSEGQTI